MELVKILIPIYKTNLSTYEILSIKQTLHILSNYPIVIICPISLNLIQLRSLIGDVKIEIERFDDSYFKGIKGYNHLMLSEDLYKRFISSKYILICQTDAYVFKDELMKWCEMDYDYIGAPWLASRQNFLKKITDNINDIIRNIKGKKKRNWEHLFKVGNGGFSLRKVKSFYEITSHYKELIFQYRNNNDSIYSIEDVFWSLKAVELNPQFKIPDYKKAVSFAIDRKPDIAMKLNNNHLPFACHGFNKPKVKKFWEKIIHE